MIGNQRIKKKEAQLSGKTIGGWKNTKVYFTIRFTYYVRILLAAIAGRMSCQSVLSFILQLGTALVRKR